MSNIVPFDTLALAQALRDEAGFDQKQAEGTAKVFARVLVADLATKSDLADIVRKVDLEAAKTDILKSTLTMIFGAVVVNAVTVVGAMLALVKMLEH